jgi:hypothetical protein
MPSCSCFAEHAKGSERTAESGRSSFVLASRVCISLIAGISKSPKSNTMSKIAHLTLCLRLYNQGEYKLTTYKLEEGSAIPGKFEVNRGQAHPFAVRACILLDKHLVRYASQ